MESLEPDPPDPPHPDIISSIATIIIKFNFIITPLCMMNVNGVV
ncbi:hypothetical protein MNB_SM-6-823 [hydrothermal vent metagenome]|uniref:Uncharacterized protein n=1 Tax=hydrothermal vent metagenome TaxID=652676 RepID=A0A1W1CKE4_9ZZZZ